MKKILLFIHCLLVFGGLSSQTIVKGPYLQIGTSNSMIIRWETSTAANSQVTYGTSSVALTNTVSNAASVTSHSIQLTGLSPFTKYYYSIGSTTAILQSGAQNYFRTSPVPGTEAPYRFWIIGDEGNASTNQTNCKNQYNTYTGSTETNGWLTLGDNAYTQGTDAQFNTEFFQIYQTDIMKNAVLWPVPGNHDYNNGASTATTVPYYSYFSTPTNAEAGGMASGNPAYYSYDYGNIHFLALDSYGTVGGKKMYDTTGTQCLWIKSDLAATNKRWKVAYWHHPPYTMGSHNSDTESDLVKVHTDFIRVLERLGVDLILCGHSHDYERTRLINGHYGNEASFSAASHNISTSSGLYDGSSNSCPYMKDSVIQKKGTVYVVAGSSGQLGGTQSSFPHAAMYYSNATNGGSLVMDVNANRLDMKWLCADGSIRDKFTMFKDVNKIKTFTVTPTQTTIISASWPGNYIWSNTATTSSISVTTSVNTTFWVKDPNNCVADSFRFVVAVVPPSVNFNYSAGPYCNGSPVFFSDASSNSPTSWSWSVTPSAGVIITTPTSQNPSITFGNSGTYTVAHQSSNSGGPGSPLSKTITISPSPSITTVSNPTTGVICLSSSITFSSSGASTYTWSGGITNTVPFTPTASGSYTVTGIAANGCTNTAVRSITVNPLPIVSSIANPTSAIICNGSSIILSGTGASTYTWSGGITDAVAFTPTSSATYTVTGTNINGCQNTAIRSITVNPLPVISASTSNSIICTGQSATLTASGASTYSWSTSSTTATISVTPSITTTYSVSGVNANNCLNSTVLTQSVSACTGLQQIALNNGAINIYPNPNNGIFNIDFSGMDNLEVEIYNSSNKLVFSGTLHSGFNKIDLKTGTGIYYYNIIDKNTIISKGKLIIQ